MTVREKAVKWTVTILLTACYIFLPVTGYGGENGSMLGHFIYPLCHGNIWHLLGNLFVLWMLTPVTCEMLAVGTVTAILGSWLPVVGFWSADMTVGFSGVLFAMIGILWGRCCKKDRGAYWNFGKRIMPLILIGAVIPYLNWSIHLYCVLIGLLYGRCR